MDFYEILGLGRDADDPSIRSAYRILARRYHPDSGIGSNADKFREAAEAYETLIDPNRRRAYDVSLRPPSRSEPVRVEPLRPEPLYAEPTRRFPLNRGVWAHNDPFDDLFRLMEEELFRLFK